MLYRKVGVKNVNFKVDPKMLQQLRKETDLEREMEESLQSTGEGVAVTRYGSRKDNKIKKGFE